MHGAATGEDPLDNLREPASPEAAASSSEAPPIGLRRQIGAVRDAIRRLLGAHVELAKTEAGEIAGEIGRVALLGGIALGAVLMVGLLLPIGGLLFLGDWLLGSIGWGVVLGTLALVDVAVIAALLGLGVHRSRIGRDFLIALVAGILVAVLLMLTLTGARLGTALGLFVFLVTWPAVAGYGVARRGIDTEALRSRFYPTQTIETTKETIEWVRERTPLGRKS
jgi:hypothetical protein